MRTKHPSFGDLSEEEFSKMINAPFGKAEEIKKEAQSRARYRAYVEKKKREYAKNRTF